MKRITHLAIALTVLAVITVVTSVYYLSYQLSADRSRLLPHSSEETGSLSLSGNGDSKTDVSSREARESQALAANDSQEIYISSRMDYLLQTYDAAQESLTEQEQKVPVEMYGLTREDLESYLLSLAEEENKSLQAAEDNRQVSYQLMAFSRDSFTVRKTYTETKPEYALFVIAENGFLTAYTGDLKSVYEYTEIPLGDFPLEQQAMLTKGVYMKTLSDYYDFLETYSS